MNLEQFSQGAIAVSPDGTAVVFAARSGVSTQLFVRRIGELESRPLGVTGTAPFFSPDGKWLGFLDGPKLYKVSAGGGAPVAITEILTARGAAWAPDDTILFRDGRRPELLAVSANGGTPRPITSPDPGTGHFWPEVLPGGTGVLFVVHGGGGNFNDASIAVQALPNGKPKVLIAGGSAPRYSPTGHLLYVRDRSLMAVRFDAVRLEVQGTPTAVLDGISRLGAYGVGQYAISANGTLVYGPYGASEPGGDRLAWVDRSGAAEVLGAEPRAYSDPRLSPDGRQVALRIATADGNEIWTHDVGTGTLTRATFEAGTKETPVWSPDGRWLAYAAATGTGRRILRKRADGSGSEERLAELSFHAHLMGWMPDGRGMLLNLEQPASGWDIFLLSLGDKPEMKPLVTSRFDEVTPALSPDGLWLAYSSDESGRREVYVRPFPSLDGRWQISAKGGTHPLWSRNGRELFFRGEGHVMSVTVMPGKTFERSAPRRLFPDDAYVAGSTDHVCYDVAIDGKRLLMIASGRRGGEEHRPIVVQNWFTELLERVPVRR